MDDFEIFIGHYPSNTFFSLDNEVFMFNTTDYSEEDMKKFKEGDFRWLVDNNRNVIKLDSMMFYRMFLGQISFGTCRECGSRLGTRAGGTGFGELP